ncbi:hypothetical protein B0H14DRAFT_3462671 [Mycena olivaceomarginata]|nr:hypothetical protein B0H14DRAFT_3462671 [Mycena olivaceomarginata]
MNPRAARRAQVRALVPAALDFDSPAPPLALSLRTSSPSLQRKKSTQSASHKRTAAFIVRRRRHPATTNFRASVITPCDLDRSSGGDLLFAPYLPLGAQYERGLTVPSSYLHLRLSSSGRS